MESAVEPDEKYDLYASKPIHGDATSCPSPPSIACVGWAPPGEAVGAAPLIRVADGTEVGVAVGGGALVGVAAECAPALTTIFTQAWCGKNLPEGFAICQKLVYTPVAVGATIG